MTKVISLVLYVISCLDTRNNERKSSQILRHVSLTLNNSDLTFLCSDDYIERRSLNQPVKLQYILVLCSWLISCFDLLVVRLYNQIFILYSSTSLISSSRRYGNFPKSSNAFETCQSCAVAMISYPSPKSQVKSIGLYFGTPKQESAFMIIPP